MMFSTSNQPSLIRRIIHKLHSTFTNYMPVMFDVVGLVLIAAGIAMVYLPVGVIALGVAFLLMGWRAQS